MALTDASGNAVVTYSYDAWGNELSSSGTVTLGDGSRTLREANPFRYSSYFFDQTSGLYYLNARYYSPKLGRFLSRDAASGLPSTPLTMNKYAYCLNNPVMWTDPSGYWVAGDTIEISAWFIVGLTIGIGFFTDSNGQSFVTGSLGVTAHLISAGLTVGRKKVLMPDWNDAMMVTGNSLTSALSGGLTPARLVSITGETAVIDPHPGNHPLTEDGSTMQYSGGASYGPVVGSVIEPVFTWSQTVRFQAPPGSPYQTPAGYTLQQAD